MVFRVKSITPVPNVIMSSVDTLLLALNICFNKMYRLSIKLSGFRHKHSVSNNAMVIGLPKRYPLRYFQILEA